jgi:beta-glucosidase
MCATTFIASVQKENACMSPQASAPLRSLARLRSLSFSFTLPLAAVVALNGACVPQASSTSGRRSGDVGGDSGQGGAGPTSGAGGGSGPTGTGGGGEVIITHTGGATGSSAGGTGGGGSANPTGGSSGGGQGGSGVVKMDCASTQSAFPYSTPYVPSATVQNTVTSLMANMNNTQKANQLRGTLVGQFTDIERTAHDKNNTSYTDTGGVREFLFRDASRGINFAVDLTTPTGGFATAFPVSMARGASFDLDLENRIGQAVGDEMVASGHTMILAPCVNILRHPLWGRASETYGEDSFHLGRMGSAYTLGLQQYVAACAKHYAANNIENGRQSANAVLDEQTLREIYARHFEMIIKDGGIAGIMASYNKVNGTYATENKHLLTDILRTDFGFKGLVLSDWWAIQNHQATAPNATFAANAINAGLEIELGWNLNYQTLESLVSGGTIPQSLLDQATRHVLEQKVRFNGHVLPPARIGLKAATSVYNGSSITNNDDHIALAQEAAVKAMVLLKNDASTLPLNRTALAGKTIAVLGRSVNYGAGIASSANDQNAGIVDFTNTPRTGDLGSSRVFIDRTKASGPLDGIRASAGSGITVVTGAAASAAASADVVVVVAGLTPLDEGEEYTGAGDRTDFNLDMKTPGGQIQLINDVIALHKPMVLVLEGGSVINIPSLASIPAVVMAFYPGMDGGRALGKLLFGDANFSGKLPFSWPKQLSDLPAFGPASGTTMDYYLGYRYYDKNAATRQPLFPYGYGLSYTKFDYANLVVPCGTVNKDGMVNVTVEVTNSGTVAGDEVAFLFVSFPSTTARRSLKELKGFYRVSLDAGVTKRITIPLRVADLKYWNMTTSQWVVESGPVKVMVGGRSDSLPVSDTFTVN